MKMVDLMIRAVAIGLALAGAAGAAEQGGAVDPATGHAIEDLPVAPPSISSVQPTYPPAAEQAGIEGSARLVIAIDDAGAVKGADIVVETPEGQGFGPAAVAGIVRWRFPAGAPGRYRISIDFKMDNTSPLPSAPKATHRAQPKYPRRAEEGNIAGNVIVAVTIDDAGKPAEVQVLSDVPAGYGFGRAAQAAVEQWEFYPHQPGRYSIFMKFRIQNIQATDTPAPPLPLAPEPLTRTAPEYPIVALAFAIEATLHLAIKLDDGGKVTALAVIRNGDISSLFGDLTAGTVIDWTFPKGMPGLYDLAVDFTRDELAKGRLRRQPDMK